MQPSWDSLNDVLMNIPPDGDRGFERFVADLLAAHFKRPFLIARKGDQPSGDAYSPKEGIVVQAKRYTSTSFSENEIVGDIHRSIGNAKDLDLYVLASTRSLGQLAARLEFLGEELGVDFIPLTLEKGQSPLASLCVEQWAHIRNYLPGVDESWNSWAKEKAGETKTSDLIQTLDSAFHASRTRQAVAKKCELALAARFIGERNLAKAIFRETISHELQKWWDNESLAIAALEGEEGMGKSWTAASFVKRFSQITGNVIFWLDSHQWTDARTPEQILDLCLEDVFTGEESVRKAIKRKVLKRWTAPILIVLDGANERSAWDAAESIVKSYRGHSDVLHTRVRILFTTRPLSARSPTFQRIWEGYPKIQTSPFSDSELLAALEKLNASLKPTDLPGSVRDLACIPRYLRLCVELREQVASFSNVTKETLLWLDLRTKVQNADPQIKTIHSKLAATPEELLSELAKASGWPKSEAVPVAKQSIVDLFSEFDSIRSDLVEQRIVLPSSTAGSIELSSSHVILGWALWLRQYSEKMRNLPRSDLRDKLLLELEPAASNDLKARALQTAALLSFLDPAETVTNQTRALLLELWIQHHNAFLGDGSLRFFAERDVKAYSLAIEGLFVRHFGGNLETELTVPLVRIWKDKSAQVSDLKEVLRRWLLLIFPGGRDGSERRDVEAPTRFPVADSFEQLRLSYVAISIISFRPEEDMLETLVDCYRSQDFCHADIQSGAQIHRYPAKTCGEPLGVLLRWNYPEKLIAKLETIASNPQLSKDDRDSVVWVAELFRQADLPPELAAPRDIFSGGGVSPDEDLLNLRAYLLKEPTPSNRKRIGFGSLGAWPVRSDLAPLSAQEIRGLKAEMENRASNPMESAYNGTWENEEFEDLIPWCAKESASTLEDVAVKIWLIQADKPHFPAVLPTLVALGLGHPKLATVIDHILKELPRNASVAEFEHAIVVPVTEMILLHGTTDQTARWFHWLEDKHSIRLHSPIIGLLPIPTAIRLLGTPELKSYAKRETDRLLESWQRTPATANLDGLALWLKVYALLVKVDETVSAWAINLAYDGHTPKQLAFPLFLIVANAPDLSIVLRGLKCPLFSEYTGGYNSWRWGGALLPEKSSPDLVPEVVAKCSLTTAGWIISNLNAAELSTWAIRVLTTANQAVAAKGDSIERCAIVQRVEEGDKLGIVSHERLPLGKTSHHSILSSTWGIDRSSEVASATNDQYKLAAEEADEEISRRRTLPQRELIEFNAFGPLGQWCQQNKNEFTAFAVNFLKNYSELNVGRVWELATFASGIFVLLLRNNPDQAISLFAKQNRNLRVIDGDTGLTWASTEIWNSSLTGVPVIEEARLNYLLNAASDEAILQHVLMARRNGVNLEKLAFDLLKEPRAKERALAVSLLAFVGSRTAEEKLSELRSSDSSFWVRSHAHWAFEVSATENDCRAWYAATLAEDGSLSRLEARLVAMKKALSPTTEIWRHSVEEEAGLTRWESRSRARLKLFWEHNEPNAFREGVWKILGRKLSEYCRGESLKEGVTSRQYPWWRPEL